MLLDLRYVAQSKGSDTATMNKRCMLSPVRKEIPIEAQVLAYAMAEVTRNASKMEMGDAIRIPTMVLIILFSVNTPLLAGSDMMDPTIVTKAGVDDCCIKKIFK